MKESSHRDGQEARMNVPNLPKRLHGTVVYDRLHREVYALTNLVESYQARRRRDAEDAVTKEVFDALDDAGPILAELQGLLDALESTLFRAQRDVFAEARALKEQKAAERNPQSNEYEPTRYRVATHVLRQLGE